MTDRTSRGSRAWPLPISLYQLVLAAAGIAFVIAMGLLGLAAVQGGTLLVGGAVRLFQAFTITTGLLLVGLLLSHVDRWRPQFDTWRAPRRLREGKPSIEVAVVFFAVSLLALIFTKGD
jgi:hypothetical protein